MNIKTLTERIANAEKKIQKKQATIIKKHGWIEKKTATLDSLPESERKWAEFDIKDWKEDIGRIQKEIEETKKTLENYQKQLSGEIERQKSWVSEVPEVLKSFQTQLVEKWDTQDMTKREQMNEDYRTMSYHDFLKKYRGQDTQLRHKTDEQIHDANVKDAKGIILNLVNRVKGITGDITDWKYLRVTIGTYGGAVLNGLITGKEGRCCVESIGAGGYNIQRYHIRVLVKPIN